MPTLATRKKIIHYLKQHVSFNEKEERERLKKLENDDSIIEINHDNQLVGIFQVTRWNSFAHNRCAEIILACDTNDKVLLVANHMLKQLIDALKSEGVSMITSCVNNDYSQISNVFQHVNFKKWYGYVFMKHNQSQQPTSTLTKRNIIEDDFEIYCHEMGQCFIPMREAMDIKPYNVVDSLFSSAQSKEKEFKHWIKNSNNTWMYFNQDNTWVGSGLIVDNDLDDIFVVQEFQNRGYGRQIVIDLINESQKRQFNPFIGYVAWNKKAGYLYESCGFIEYMSCTYFRCFL